jgi:alpha-N-arabinofuranosidase
VAPPILEEIYTMEDALALRRRISLLNHADRVDRMPSQLVNVVRRS